ncbi:SAM and SH3 domain-containing protein 1-like [Physella acuta]|uniref:SAM and SH3 domain-containing protein 1-like n=1 Tax=Physella acuta TaxID=109671 RepID=UPI0027DE611B|nr:SAM and SH3 domain-containing protein 1-like [Physella acuta]
MECGSQTPLRTDPMSRRPGDSATYNSNSTVSMSSDTNSPATGRKKSGNTLDPRIKCHRSASCSIGDDGISSENDDTENSLKKPDSKTFQGRDNKKSTKVKEAVIARPPLIRQQSAPVGTPLYAGPYLGQAKVIVDYTPGPDEDDFVPLKVGEIVNIMNMAQSGVWRGVVNGKRGKFRFEHVEVIIEPDKTPTNGQIIGGQKDIPKSVDDLLQRIGLGHLSNLFLLNGYDDLDIFSELDDHDLDTLHISDQDQRNKLLSAAKVLGDWNDKVNAHTPTITNMDSPSSRAGNSSCDSGCYTGSEGLKQQTRHRAGELRKDRGHHSSPKSHSSCRSCGKPKQPRKYSSPGGTSHYVPGQYPTQLHSHYTTGHTSHGLEHSPYAPGHFQYGSLQQMPVPYTSGYYGYHQVGGHSHYAHGHPHYVMSASRTLTELNVADNHNSTPTLETFKGVGNTGLVAKSDKKPSVGDRVSLTEEDQEVIAITCGTNQSRKLSTPIQTMTGGSPHLEMPSSVVCKACVPSSGCQQCDESILCESSSCVQCATYASCPQCFPYRHYVNTTMRSDSKSSKMSCSSTCTQTTCLSPDHDDSNNSAGSNLIDCSITSPGYMTKASPNRVQPFYFYQQQYSHPIYERTLSSIAGRTTPSQLPSPAPAATGLPVRLTAASPLTLALTDSSANQGVSLTLQTEPNPPLVPDWAKQTETTEAPGMATLYSRGQTPEKSDASSGQLKSPTRSLMPLVTTKLSAERINLTQIPYSTAIGHCGIPPLLVQRYSEELRQEMDTMALVIEQIREKQLRALGRPCIQNESLSDSCKHACDLQISSVQSFLISIGLPMYLKPLTDGNITTLDQMLKLKESELEQITGADSRHLKRITHALEWVQVKLSSPNHKPRVAGVTDKV